jgi:hypothetical protein
MKEFDIMGGNALKIETRRINQDEYFIIERTVLEKLGPYLPRLATLQAYANKPDFGDLDIVVAKPMPDHTALVEIFGRELNSREAIFNSDNVSFEYQNFQVDLIFVEPEEFEIAQVYFAFNDLGNLIGRVAHKFGLKYGFQGLVSPIKDDNGSHVADLLLSREPQAIFEFLGFDYSRYLQGFAELEDIFKFVIDSKYFDYHLFDLENLNNINRTRNRKRKTYNLFLAYLKDHNITKEFTFNPDKATYVPWIAQSFPAANFYAQLESVQQELEQRRQLAAKFNGRIVMELFPNLSGKQLGDFIANFKKQYADFNLFVQEASEAQIMAELLDFHSRS